MQFLSALCASLLLSAAIVPAAAAPLAAERWNKRIVVAFADAANEKLKRQVDGLLADKATLAERDMLVIAVAGNEVSAAYGAVPKDASADALRKSYGIAADTPFTVILIGKDGGEKLRRTEPVAAKDILRLIDSMPMRRNEAKGGG